MYKRQILNGECGEFSPRLLECFKNVREDFAALSRAYADGVGPKFKPERKELRKPETIDAVNPMAVSYTHLVSASMTIPLSA